VDTPPETNVKLLVSGGATTVDVFGLHDGIRKHTDIVEAFTQ
jgi:hypothetical protein